MSQEVFYRPWSELASQLPPDARPAREKMLLEEVRAGNYVPIEWSSVTSILNGMVLTFKVASDALRVGSPDDCVRINVTAQGTQELNDILGFTWQTTKSADLIHQQADIRISPCTQTPDARMAFTGRIFCGA